MFHRASCWSPSLQHVLTRTLSFSDYFIECDTDGSGEISLPEFYQYFGKDNGIEQTIFTDKVFLIFDEDGSGEIDFREFVLACWNFASYDMKALQHFAFNMFDTDSSGYMEEDEVRQLVQEVYGRKYSDNVRVQGVLEKIDSDGDGRVSKTEFDEFCRKYPILMWPAFVVQQALRKHLGGDKWWRTQQDQRSKAWRSSSVFEILAKLDDQQYRRHMDNAFEIDDVDEGERRWRQNSRVEF